MKFHISGARQLTPQPPQPVTASKVLTKVLIIQDNYKEAHNQIELAKDQRLWTSP